jgi:hypothetical protein
MVVGGLVFFLCVTVDHQLYIHTYISSTFQKQIVNGNYKYLSYRSNVDMHLIEIHVVDTQEPTINTRTRKNTHDKAIYSMKRYYVPRESLPHISVAQERYRHETTTET